MKINKLKINSYGKLKDKELDLSENINIIYGQNEAGKSTLLRFIANSFYGISKNKKGKEISDYEKYTPWSGDEFSGKLEYELDNKETFEIYRDFKKKNPKIFNGKMEDISNEFNIDKTKGNEFFYEQTKMDEDLFQSTIVVNQQEVKLEKGEQNVLIQKIANLVGTGDDNVSFKRAIDRINKRQLDEIGTERSREKPINILNKEIIELENAKRDLIRYEDSKYQIDEVKNDLLSEITELEKEYELLKEIKFLKEKEKIEEERIKAKENIKNQNSEKINLLKNKIDEIKNDNSQILDFDIEENKNNKKNTKQKKKLNVNLSIIFIILVIVNVLQYIFIKNNIIKYGVLLSIPVFFVFAVLAKMRVNKKIKIDEDSKNNKKIKLDNIMNDLNKLDNEISILEDTNNSLESEINTLINNYKINTNLEMKKLKDRYLNKLEEDEINILINTDNANYEIDKIQTELNDKKINLHTTNFDQENINKKLSRLAEIEERLVSCNNNLQSLKELEESMNLAKDVLSNSYEKMKNTVTPKFTKELSDNIFNITGGKYKNVMFNEEKGLIVELENGDYVPASRLSIGTIDQLYLSLRLSMVEELSSEKMPIILDEAFAYYDTNRLENILRFIHEKFSEHQILIFTCTNREKELLDKMQIEFNYTNL